ncbi:hypothetical protein RJ641_026771, partial [Dillenia turbinata]
MEAWKPLLDIFLNSPTPESEVHSGSNNLLTLHQPLQALQQVHFSLLCGVQSLPNAVQSRILSFLTYEKQRFRPRDLSNLWVDFWVKKAAHNLLESLSERKYDWAFSLNLDSIKGRVDEEFEALPGWLKVEINSTSLLPWLPMSRDELNLRNLCSNFVEESDMLVDTEEEKEELNVVGGKIIESDCLSNAIPDSDTYKKADCLRTQILTFESVSKTVDLANMISELCLDRGKDSLTVLGLIEPWKADEETMTILISLLVSGREEELEWPGQVLCSIILPKLSVLEEPVSHRAAEYALLFSLILWREGINNHICDVLVRIIKECPHPAHASAFCQKVLCGEEEVKKLVCLPCHQSLLSTKLNVPSHGVHLTHDSVNHLVYQIQESDKRFSKSLRFGNFLLCFVANSKTLVPVGHLLHGFKSGTLVCKFSCGIEVQWRRGLLTGLYIGMDKEVAIEHRGHVMPLTVTET